MYTRRQAFADWATLGLVLTVGAERELDRRGVPTPLRWVFVAAGVAVTMVVAAIMAAVGPTEEVPDGA